MPEISPAARAAARRLAVAGFFILAAALLSQDATIGDGGPATAREPSRSEPPGAAAEPADAAAPRLREFVEAFNSGDAGRVLSFYRDNMTATFRERRSSEESRALYERLRGFIGMLEEVRVEKTGSRQLTLSALTGGGGDRAVLVFDVDPDPPHLLEGYSVDVRKGGRPESLPALELPAGARGEDLPPRLQEWLERLEERDLFSGAVILARRGTPFYRGAFGMANREASIPNTMETLFDLGSITKAFTKVAAGQLLRDGKLSLDDTVLHHLPGYPDREAGARITIRQLLEHTSGLGDIFTEEFLPMRERLLRPRDFFPLFAGKPLQFEPGSGRMYSNAGYVLLGAVIEAAAGMPYEDYVRERIFGPAGMDRSGFVERDGSRPDVAVGYTRRSGDGDHHGPPDGPPRPSTGGLPVRGCPAGSSSSSAGDLLRFYNALAEGTLLGPGWTRWYFTGTPPAADGGPERAGTAGSDPGVGVAGGAPGVNTAVESDGGWMAIVLANMDPPVAGEIARKILEAARSVEG